MATTNTELDLAQLRAYAADVRNSYLRERRRSQELKESYLATVKALAAACAALERAGRDGDLEHARDLIADLVESAEAADEGLSRACSLQSAQ